MFFPKKNQNKKIWIIIVFIGIVIFIFWLYSLNYQFSRIKSNSHYTLFGKYKRDLNKSFKEFTTNLETIEKFRKEQLETADRPKQKLTPEQLQKIETQIKEYNQAD